MRIGACLIAVTVAWALACSSKPTVATGNGPFRIEKVTLEQYFPEGCKLSSCRARPDRAFLTLWLKAKDGRARLAEGEPVHVITADGSKVARLKTEGIRLSTDGSKTETVYQVAFEVRKDQDTFTLHWASADGIRLPKP